MPTSPSRQQTPNYTDLNAGYGHTVAGIRSLDPLPFSTFGLSSAWADAYAWAIKNNVVWPLLHLIDVTLLRDKPNALGSTLSELAPPRTRDTLQVWAETSAAAALLFQLSVAVGTDPSILRNYPPLTQGRSAAKQLHGELDNHYLLALLLERLPPGSPVERQWFSMLRIWVLTHALLRAAAGNLQDIHLRMVASAIRLASDRSHDWLRLLARLQTTTENLDDLDRWLAYRAGRLLEKKSAPITLPPAQIKLLKALQNVARNVHAEDRTSPVYPRLTAAHPFIHPLGRSSNQPHAGDLLSESDDPDAHASINAQDDERADLLSIGVDPRKSYAHQQLDAHSVLLASAEDVQYLPWSWNKPNPFEADELSAWIARNLRSLDTKLQTLAAFAWIAAATGRSLRRALDIRFDRDATAEWSIDPDTLTLQRLPPMRQPGWLPDDERQRSWVRPIAPHSTLPLPDAVCAIVSTRWKHQPDATALGDFARGWEAAPEALFRNAMTGALSRVTPAMLAGLLPQRVFLESRDSTFARLLSSHPKSGLPGPCAYGSWSADAVNHALGQAPADDAPTSTGLGSRLDPIDSLLIRSIRQAGRRVIALRRSTDVVAFHNAYSAYLAMALLAATGARPIRDPFESPRHFDLDERFVYIDDKASDASHQGRLVPLPASLTDFLVGEYPRHLKLLAAALAPTHPRLASDIEGMTTSATPDALPFIFFLSPSPDIAWKSLTPSAVEELRLFEWPLPPNLFRHRLANRLRATDVDAEIIDSILGHVEAGSATHGDYSFRTWHADMEQTRAALETSFAQLRFLPLRTWSQVPTLELRAVVQSADSDFTPSFGAQVRTLARRRRMREAIRDARLQIDVVCGGRHLADLAPEELDHLCRALLFSDKGLPRTTGHLRYEYLMRQLQRIWRLQGKKVRLSRRYMRPILEKSPFSDQAPGALQTHLKLRTALREILRQAQPSRLNLVECALLAASILCLEHRIASAAVLADIMAGRNFRLVHYKGEYFVELGEGLYNDPTRAVRRHRISPWPAVLMDRLLGATQQRARETTAVPVLLQSLADEIAAPAGQQNVGDCRKLVAAMAGIVDQINVITLPGAVAAWLGGRIESGSLSWQDWLRAHEGVSLQVPDLEPEDDDPRFAETPPAGTSPLSEPNLLQRNARAFFAELRAELAGTISQGTTHATPTARRDLARRLNSNLSRWTRQVSTAVHMLGQWTASLVHRRKRKGAFVALSTVARYLAALSPAFEATAYAADLNHFDEEAVTQLYDEILQVRSIEDRRYVALRLRDFHRWARREGVEDPHWSDLPFQAVTVAPGVIREDEYQNALATIAAQPGVSSELRLAGAFLLIGCYRFALRGTEALGLTRADWTKQGDTTVLLVRDNRFRALKSSASRRQVPLLFRLSSAEQDVVRRVLANAEAENGVDASAPLLDDIGRHPKGPLAASCKRLVIATLKTVTGNRETVLHHARHTAANRVALRLTDLDRRLWHRLDHHAADETAGHPDMERLLLGTTGPTRRKGWALSRHLGHAGLHTAFRSYLHFLGDWADLLIAHDDGLQCASRPRHAIDLDAYPRMALALVPTAPVIIDATPVDLLKFMRLLTRGKAPLEAGAALSLDPTLTDILCQTLYRVGERQKLSGIDAAAAKTLAPLAFLDRIPEASWNRLIRGTANRWSGITATVPTNAAVSASDLAAMVGPTRQLIMWQRGQFALVRTFLDFYDIGPERIRILCSNAADVPLFKVAAAYRLAPSPAGGTPATRRVQVDAAYAGDGCFRVEKRCAIMFVENADFMIRNSIEFAVAFVGHAVAIRQATHRS